MDKEELKSLITALLQEATDKGPRLTASPSARPKSVSPAADSAILPDISEIDLRKQYLVSSPANAEGFLRLKAKTPARLGVGRAGPRYKTETLLRLRADHAAAQDSVFSQVPQEFWKDNHLIYTKTRCKDKDEYLTRPDLGRTFDEENSQIIRANLEKSPQVQLVIGDGLSSQAILANAMDCAQALGQGLKTYGITLGPALYVDFCRVGAGDSVGDLTGCQVVCVLVGERPGLVTAESMSAYVTYNPHRGISESKRTVVSNIHAQGTPAVEAGAHLAQLISTILQKKASGVDLTR